MIRKLLTFAILLCNTYESTTYIACFIAININYSNKNDSVIAVLKRC